MKMLFIMNIVGTELPMATGRPANWTMYWIFSAIKLILIKS